MDRKSTVDAAVAFSPTDTVPLTFAPRPYGGAVAHLLRVLVVVLAGVINILPV
jgi:hypothetical protein